MLNTTFDPGVAARRRDWSMASSGWVPVVVVYIGTALLVVRSGVSVRDTAIFSAYAIGCLVLPGTLLWRWMFQGQQRPFVADVVFGTGLAYAVELAVYIPARWADHPRLVLVWPVVVVGASLLGRWRRDLWTPRETSRLPSAWSWSIAGICLFAVAWVAQEIWRYKPISPRGLRSPYVDDSYHLGLVAELRHHFPIASPFVDGEPLYYHWFVHGEIAATSWSTGIEPIVLLQRLSMLPMIFVFLLGAGLLAARLCRSALLGLVAPAIVVLGGANVLSYYSNLYLSDVLYLSPTTTLAQMLLVSLLALLFARITRESGRIWLQWIAIALLMVGCAGSKATVVPILIVGIGAALGLHLLLRRRIDLTLTAMLLLAIGAFGFATLFIYGGGSRGLQWDPFVAPAYDLVALGAAPSVADVDFNLKLLSTVVYVLANLTFLVAWLGLLRKETWRDARAQILVGASCAGIGASLLLSGQSLAQLYFIRVTPLLLAISVAWGFANLLPAQLRRTQLRGLIAAAAFGAIVAGIVTAMVANGTLETWSEGHPVGLLVPFAIVALGAIAVAALGVFAARNHGPLTGMTAAMVVAYVLAMGAPAAITSAHDMLSGRSSSSDLSPGTTIGPGGIAAARWLRDHSDPDDLVATNAHTVPSDCLDSTRNLARPTLGRFCSSRHFWVAGLSERRALIEGWAYEVENLSRAEEEGRAAHNLAFWDPERLAANDSVFTDPSPEALERFRDEDGVSWLFVDLQAPNDLEKLQDFATLRYRNGQFAVLSLP